MRLTNQLREAILRAVTADIPRHPYGEEIRVKVQAAFIALAPKTIRTALQDPLSERYLNYSQICVTKPAGVKTWRNHHVTVLCPVDGTTGYLQLPEAVREEIDALYRADNEEELRYQDVRNMVHAALQGYTTTKAFATAYPELARYLPAEDAPPPVYPVAVANVVSTLTAAGWPKDKPAKA